MQERMYLKNSLGLKLSAVLEMPDLTKTSVKLPLVIICHGLGSSKDGSTCTVLADKLRKAGIASIRFDFVCHGESEGVSENLTISQCAEDLKTIINFVSNYEKIDTSRMALFGRSFGGSVVLKYLASGSNIGVISLNAPAVDFAEALRNIYGEAGMESFKRDGYKKDIFRGKERRLSYKTYLDALNQNNYEKSRSIKSKVLIVHGSKDDTVPVEQSIKLKEIMGDGAELRIIENANHEFNPGKMKEAIELSVEFFKQNF